MAPHHPSRLPSLLLAERGARVDDPDAWACLAASRHKSKVKAIAPLAG